MKTLSVEEILETMSAAQRQATDALEDRDYWRGQARDLLAELTDLRATEAKLRRVAEAAGSGLVDASASLFGWSKMLDGAARESANAILRGIDAALRDAGMLEGER